MRATLLILTCLIAQASSALASEPGVFYDSEELGVESELTLDEKQILSEVKAVYSELDAIRARGNSKEEIEQHRDYRLVPTLRTVARKAEALSSSLLLGKALELASCESDPRRSYEWTDVLTKAVNNFGENDFKRSVEALPSANRISLRTALAANLPKSFKWTEALSKLSEWGGDEAEIVEVEVDIDLPQRP